MFMAKDDWKVTSQWLNVAKNTSLPIALQFIADFVRSSQSHLDSVQVGDDLSQNALDAIVSLQGTLVNKILQAMDVRYKWPRSKKERLGIAMGQEQLEYYRQEWRTGRPHPGSPCPGRRHWIRFWTAVDNVRFTDGRLRPRLTHIVDEIEIFTGVHLPRSHDGCAYFGYGAPPSTWSWSSAQVLLKRRLETLQNWCNKGHESVEDWTTLYLECVFQVSITRMVPRTELQRYL